MFSDDTIAAISTPLGEGGIGIVRLSGKDSKDSRKNLLLTAKKDTERYKITPHNIWFYKRPFNRGKN